MIAKIGIILACVVWSSARVDAEEVRIEFFNSSFIPQTVDTSVSDVLVFQWVRGTHRVRSGTGPDDPAAGTLFDFDLDAKSPRVELPILLEYVGGFSFFDTNNPDIVGFVSVDRGEESFRVGVVDNVFIPDVVYVFAGDTVRWEHEPKEMFHTVTSGLSSAPEHDPGALFDEPLQMDEFPVFEYRFDEAASYPYFCRPHESLDMNGVVWVQHTFVRADTTGDEVVDISDPVATLGFLFLGGEVRDCGDALDANDDGVVDLADPIFTLAYLFLGGEVLPGPFPVSGADRSPDDLLCMLESV